MSAIYGTISESEAVHNDINSHLKPFGNYKFDRNSKMRFNKVQFACYHQELTVEAKSEVLPFLDRKSNCIITADAILDNRKELIELLGVMSDEVTDSYLILEAYYKWGNDSPKYLLGSFAYSIYNRELDELILVRDQIGTRTLYYRCDESEFVFSTLMNPLRRKNQDLNDTYIKRFLAINTVIHDYHSTDTIYKEINHVLPGHMIIYKNSKIVKSCYWRLGMNKRKRRKKRSFEETNKEYKKIFDEAILCRLRSSGEVGIALSGGYDSSAIACTAAKKMKLENRQLYTYTSIASSKFDVTVSDLLSIDESELVRDIGKMYPNMVLSIQDFHSLTPINTIDKIMEIVEQPFKTNVNAYWDNAITEIASQDNCKVLLTGQTGNSTFSYTDIDKYYFHLVKTLQLKKFYDEFSQNCRYYNLSRIKNIKRLVKKVFKPERFNGRTDLIEYVKINDEERKYLIDFMNNDIASYDITKSIHEVIENSIEPSVINHISAIETKVGLANNIITRDPTRDVRLLEFLYELSIENFNYRAYGRTLATAYMKDLVPDSVIFSKLKGIQGADYIHRINDEWEEFFRDLNNDLASCEYIKNFIDIEVLKLDLNEFETLKLEDNRKYMRKIVNLLILSCCIKFINSNEIL